MTEENEAADNADENERGVAANLDFPKFNVEGFRNSLEESFVSHQQDFAMDF